MQILQAAVWRERQAIHRAAVDRWLVPHAQRRRDRVADPIGDFLYTYYSFRPHQLRRWHPGFGVQLQDAAERKQWRGYSCTRDGNAFVTLDYLRTQVDTVERIHELLAATRDRAPSFGCFGLHEWAMVYRARGDDLRHSQLPLRLSPNQTDQVVEENRIACSHFDAVRFFTEQARPLNTFRPQHHDRVRWEQPGCLHANMDLYKHAARMSGLIPSELIAATFDLAHRVRVLDMRASPYDLRQLGHSPVPVETPEGRVEYRDAQRSFAREAAPLRQALIQQCESLLAMATNRAGESEPRQAVQLGRSLISR